MIFLTPVGPTPRSAASSTSWGCQVLYCRISVGKNSTGTMERLDQGHLRALLEQPTQTFPCRGSNPGLHGGRRVLRQRAIAPAYAIAIWNLYSTAQIQFFFWWCLTVLFTHVASFLVVHMFCLIGTRYGMAGNCTELKTVQDPVSVSHFFFFVGLYINSVPIPS